MSELSPAKERSKRTLESTLLHHKPSLLSNECNIGIESHDIHDDFEKESYAIENQNAIDSELGGRERSISKVVDDEHDEVCFSTISPK
jgi:hypothetical protein